MRSVVSRPFCLHGICTDCPHRISCGQASETKNAFGANPKASPYVFAMSALKQWPERDSNWGAFRPVIRWILRNQPEAALHNPVQILKIRARCSLNWSPSGRD